MPTKSKVSENFTPYMDSDKSQPYAIWLALFVIVVMGINIGANWLIAQEAKIANRENTTTITRAIEKSNETALMQFGNAENFELYKQVQGLKAPEIKSQIQAELSKAQGGTPSAPPSDPSAPQAMKKLTDEQYKALFANTYVEGKAGAKLTIAEFSDFECPWCIRHFSEGTVKSLMTKYATSTNFTFHPIVLANHPNAIPKSYAALCVGKYAGAEAFTTFMKSVFTASVTDIVGLDKIPALAAAAKVDAAKFKTCYDSQETKGAFDAIRKVSNDLGVNGTPATFIINNETKEYTLVSGAAPLANFEQAIDAMLK